MIKSLMTTCLLCAAVLAVAADDSPKTTAAKEPQLRSELLLLTDTDQAVRKTLIEWMKKNGSNGNVVEESLGPEQKADFEKMTTAMTKVDKENTNWLKDVVEKYGWPTNTMVGKDGASAAWLLVQHADADIKFQRKCLDLMSKLPKEEVSQVDFAYLTDRVLLAEGKKQVYGTQFTGDGKLQPEPIEDEANVDKRRKEVGLPPLAEYAKSIEEMYGGNPKK
jgi:hypothetical protein